jgi:cellulose synthase/poly-beta-1,6-N-acetylglucosamine synthase-like glycosyltransferase
MKTPKVSVCVTTFNETGERVKKLLDALSKQTLKPDEIIIVDAKDYDNCSRSKGRNIAIKKAKNEIIAITDVGCLPHSDWLEKLVKPFDPTTSRLRGASVVSGGYKMVAKNNFEKAESVFLGVKQNDMDKDFIPSARSMAFTKTIWKKVGGFPEDLDDTAEDTVFNLNLIEAGAKFVTVKTAVIEWEMPATIKEFAKKIHKYAKGDAQSGIWWHPVKKWRTHNIKVLTIFARYIVAIATIAKLLNYSMTLGYSSAIALICIYSLWAYKKAGLWGILLQFVSDFAAVSGFLNGIVKKSGDTNK